MGFWPYYSNALLYGDYANEANLHTRTKVHGIVIPDCVQATILRSLYFLTVSSCPVNLIISRLLSYNEK